jgi:hypothetical protein
MSKQPKYAVRCIVRYAEEDQIHYSLNNVTKILTVPLGTIPASTGEDKCYITLTPTGEFDHFGVTPKLTKSSTTTTMTIVQHLLSIGNRLNPLCSVKSFTPGGIVLSSSDQLYLQGLNQQGHWKGLNLTTARDCTIEFKATDFYINPYVATVYRTLWELLAYFQPEAYEQHKIGPFGGEDLNALIERTVDYLHRIIACETTNLNLYEVLTCLPRLDREHSVKLVRLLVDALDTDPQLKSDKAALIDNLRQLILDLDVSQDQKFTVGTLLMKYLIAA